MFYLVLSIPFFIQFFFINNAFVMFFFSIFSLLKVDVKADLFTIIEGGVKWAFLMFGT